MIGHMPWLYNKHQSHFIGPLKVDFKKKDLQLLTVQDSLNPYMTFLGEKLWPVALKK